MSVDDLTRAQLWELVDELEPSSVELEIEWWMQARGLTRVEAEEMVALQHAREGSDE